MYGICTVISIPFFGCESSLVTQFSHRGLLIGELVSGNWCLGIGVWELVSEH